MDFFTVQTLTGRVLFVVASSSCDPVALNGFERLVDARSTNLQWIVVRVRLSCFFQRHFCFFPVPLSMLECARIADVPSVLDEKQP